MASTLSEVDERVHENGLADGPSNPLAQHAYDGFAKRPSRSGTGLALVLGAAAVALALALASIFGLWLLRSVRRLNRQVTQLNRQTEQLNRRLQSAEQQAKALDQKASQAAADAQSAVLQGEQMKASQATSAAPAPSPLPTTAAAKQRSNQAGTRAEENRSQREKDLQSLQQSLGQIADTHRTAAGLVMTLGEKSLRFSSDKSDIAPQYRGILNRIAGVLKTVKGYSIYVYGYTDENGTKDYNLRLSTRRAGAVRDALVKAGLDPSLISTKGFGRSKPRARGTNATARAANRRVEIGIVDSSEVSAEQPVSKVGSTR